MLLKEILMTQIGRKLLCPMIGRFRDLQYQMVTEIQGNFPGKEKDGTEIYYPLLRNLKIIVYTWFSTV